MVVRKVSGAVAKSGIRQQIGKLFFSRLGSFFVTIIFLLLLSLLGSRLRSFVCHSDDDDAANMSFEWAKV